MIFIKRFQIQNIDCFVEVVVKRQNKHIYLRVRNGNIYITSPKALSDSFIKQFIEKNYTSIYRALQAPPSVSNSLHFFGKKYSIEITNSIKDFLLIEEDTIHIFTKKKDNSYIQKIVSSFYAKELSKFVENHIQNIKYNFHIDFDISFSYKDVKTYFGECFPKRKHIILSTKLAKYEPKYILSVIYHELAHFFYQNHSMQFYALLELVFPNYKVTQKELRKIKYNDIF